MTTRRATFLRLDRQIAEGGSASPVAEMTDIVREAYDQLASAVVAAATEQGYLGQDPTAALGELLSPNPEERQLARLILDLWDSFFSSFREDERAHEAKRFLAEAEGINDAVERLAPGEDPDVPMLATLLELLLQFWDDRHAQISGRLDSLIEDLNQHQSELGSADMERAFRDDEVNRLRQIVLAALLEIDESVGTDSRMVDDVEQLVSSYRKKIKKTTAEHKQLQEESEEDMARLLSILVRALRGEKNLDKAAHKKVQAIITAVSELRQEFIHLEKDNKHAARLHANMQVENKQLCEENAHLQERLRRYEFGEVQASATEDERLELYRQAAATWELGGNPAELIERIRELERVLIIPQIEHDTAVQHLDRQLEVISKGLADCNTIIDLEVDAKQYRPRLLRNNPYKLKEIAGQLQAHRDACRDVVTFIDRARWASGLKRLLKDFRGLRRIFGEMVKLAADVRSQQGGAPLISMTLNLQTTDALAHLPIVLADDIEAIMRRRGGPKTAASLTGLLADVLEIFQAALERAIGKPLVLSEVPKRESAAKGLARMCVDLRTLAAELSNLYAEAQDNGWQLSEEEQSLLENEHALVMLVQQVDLACDVIAVLPGAPEAVFGRIPTGKKSALDKVLAAGKERCEWLEQVAAYRLQIG